MCVFFCLIWNACVVLFEFVVCCLLFVLKFDFGCVAEFAVFAFSGVYFCGKLFMKLLFEYRRHGTSASNDAVDNDDDVTAWLS